MKLAKPTIRFNTELSHKTGSVAILTLPKNISAKLPSRDEVTAEGTINGLPFRTSFEPDGKGSHLLKVSKEMQKFARASTGDIVTVEITRLGDETETRVPADLRKALTAAPKALALWGDITPIARRDWIFWLITGRLKETRVKRIEKACDMLSHGKKRVCCFAGINWLMKGR